MPVKINLFSKRQLSNHVVVEVRKKKIFFHHEKTEKLTKIIYN